MKAISITIVSLLVAISTIVASAAEYQTPIDDDTYMQLQEIYASGLAVSADLVLPADTSRFILQEIFASGLAVSADLVLPREFVPSRVLLEEIYASGLALSNNLTIAD